MSNASSKAKNAGNLKMSAGILVYRRTGKKTEVLLAHPGGPYWKNKDAGSWTVPKGEPEPGEPAADAARREFLEETGWDLGDARLDPLTPVKQKSGKWIHAWATEADRPANDLFSNEFEMEWPPRSGKKKSFPEMDRFEWLGGTAAREKINPAQRALLDELEKKLASA